jgi:predicted ATPase
MILCFEDLHWVDESTLALLAYLAQPQPLGRLLLLGTYRPVRSQQLVPRAEHACRRRYD